MWLLLSRIDKHNRANDIGVIVRFLLPVISGLMMSAAFPPLDIGILAWIGLSPFLFSLRRAKQAEIPFIGLIFGLVFIGGVFLWGPQVSAIGWQNYILMLIPLSLYFMLFGFFYRRISNAAGTWILIGAPALWVLIEYVRANLFFLAWPWNLLGHSQYRYLSLIQIGDITGVYGISFLIVLVNQWLSQVPEYFGTDIKRYAGQPKERNRLVIEFLAVIGIFATVFAYGLHRLDSPPSGKQIRVALVQANKIVKENMTIGDQAEHLNVYKQLTRRSCGEDPALIIWPAASLPAAMNTSRLVRHAVTKLTRETKTYLVVGGAGVEKMKPKKKGYLAYSNSEFLIDPLGRIKGQYNKMRLVPFNEYLPLQGKIHWPEWITTLKESFTPGKDYFLFNINGVKFGAPICWENMFPDLFRQFVKGGANFMVSATNEAFFGRTAAPHQTLAMTVFRAVENRIAIARSAPTGVSAFINPDGSIVERIMDINGDDLFVEGFIVRDIPLSDKKTFYTMHGDIFAYCTIGLAGIFILYSFLIETPQPGLIESMI